jgi:hypothetical protein
VNFADLEINCQGRSEFNGTKDAGDRFNLILALVILSVFSHRSQWCSRLSLSLSHYFFHPSPHPHTTDTTMLCGWHFSSVAEIRFFHAAAANIKSSAAEGARPCVMKKIDIAVKYYICSARSFYCL